MPEQSNNLGYSAEIGVYVALRDRPFVHLAVRELKSKFKNIVYNSIGLLKPCLCVYNAESAIQDLISTRIDVNHYKGVQILIETDNLKRLNGLTYVLLDGLEFVEFNNLTRRQIEEIVDTVQVQYVYTVLAYNNLTSSDRIDILPKYLKPKFQKKLLKEIRNSDYDILKAGDFAALFLYLQSGLDIQSGVLDTFIVKYIEYSLWTN